MRAVLRFDYWEQGAGDMRCALFVIIACLYATSTFAGDPAAEKIKRYMQEQQPDIDARIARCEAEVMPLEKKLAVLEKGVVRKNVRVTFPPTSSRPYYVFPSQYAKDLQVKEVEKKLAAAKTAWADAKTYKPFPPLLESDLRLSDAGMVGRPIRVIQVLGKQKALVELEFVVGRERFDHTAAILQGIDTTPFADGSTLDTRIVFEVTGKETYETAIGGSKTVFVLQPFDMKRLDAVK